MAIELNQLPGVVATVCLSGTVTPEYSVALSNLRSWNDRNQFWKVEYTIQHAVLVESGRDAVCKHALDNKYEWILQIDADASSFPDDALFRVLKTAFIDVPQIDVLGGYCQAKGWPYLPTIDTGSGKWEEHYPNEGILPVIRTGAHFLLIKTSALQKFGPPWFRTRISQRPSQAFAEVDNFARCHLDGRNPLTEHPEWITILNQARLVSHTQPSAIGEDSAFCDALRAVGGLICVDTSLVVGHVMTKTIMPDDFVKAVEESHKKRDLMLGVMGE